MRKKTQPSQMITKLEAGQKGVVIPREVIESAGFTDGVPIVIEVLEGKIVLRSPALNFSKYIGILSGK